MKRILVTGATGFLGRHLMQLLRREHCLLVGMSRHRNATGRSDIESLDITSPMDVRNLLYSFLPDVIFHLAGNPLVKESGPEVMRVNTLGTNHLLEYAPKGCRFVLASSATVYGAHASGLLAHEGFPCAATSTYAASKIAAESLVDAYTFTGRVRGISLRYVANVGPGATHGLLRDIVRKLREDSKSLELLGDAPGSTKPFIHVADTARATRYFGLDCDYIGHVNISNSDSLSVLEVATMAIDALGIHKPIVWSGQDSLWPGDIKTVRISPRKMQGLGFELTYNTSVKAVKKALEEME
jgi:UDP-glucose 4-epimerase